MKQIKLAPFIVRKELLSRKVSLFTAEDFRRIFHSSPEKTKYFLETYTKKGLFMRLKQGLYAFEGRFPTGEEIANALYKPSYISFEYALAKYSIIPEAVHVITSATTKPTRVFESGDLGFEYFKIKKQAFTGYLLTKEGGARTSSVLMAEPEKAVVDFLYFVSLGKRQLNDRLTVRRLNRKKIIAYAKLYNRPSLIQRVQKL